MPEKVVSKLQTYRLIMTFVPIQTVVMYYYNFQQLRLTHTDIKQINRSLNSQIGH